MLTPEDVIRAEQIKAAIGNGPDGLRTGPARSPLPDRPERSDNCFHGAHDHCDGCGCACHDA
jgi:hypothetical protein